MEENEMNKNILKVKEVLSKVVNVENMQSNKGNDIANQFLIYGNGWTLFQSYNSPIAMVCRGVTYIFKDWEYSITTGKYRNQFLNETKKETEAKLKSGEYIAVDFEVY